MTNGLWSESRFSWFNLWRYSAVLASGGPFHIAWSYQQRFGGRFPMNRTDSGSVGTCNDAQRCCDVLSLKMWLTDSRHRLNRGPLSAQLTALPSLNAHGSFKSPPRNRPDRSCNHSAAMKRWRCFVSGSDKLLPLPFGIWHEAYSFPSISTTQKSPGFSHLDGADLRIVGIREAITVE